MPVFKKTQIHEEEKNFTYEDSDVQKAMQLIRDKGFIDSKDFKQMDDEDWADGFDKRIEAAFLKSEGEDPYIYFEQFDFKGGDIDTIIFNMDVIKNRQAALNVLAKDLGMKTFNGSTKAFTEADDETK